MKKIRAAVIGYGNIGRYALEALEAAPDFEVAGVVRRNPDGQPEGYKVTRSIGELEGVDVAILATPSRKVEEAALPCLERGICTADSFDIHTQIPGLRARLDAAARKGGASSVVAAGWDPGTDSIVRAMLQAIAPKGLTYTNFGPGMSMGHSVAAKAVAGVRDALSMTIPAGEGAHRRLVYVELEAGADFGAVAAAIKSDPYFASDETRVAQVESVDDVKDMGHGVSLTRKGVSGQTQNQMFEFGMRINNPALTGQILVCAARAAVRQKPGCRTLIEVPVADLLPGEAGEWVARLV